MSNLKNIDINRPLDLAEKASEVLYRARAMVCTAIIINESTDIDFKKPTFRQDSLAYQLEALHQLVTQYESLFEGAASEILKNRRGAVEVLPENCAQAVFSAEPAPRA
jgi:hypothetical protein